MIQKIKNQALEQYNIPSTSVYVTNGFVKTLLEQKFMALQRGLLITDDLIAEAESFMIRNRCVEHEDDAYCPNCLKAHMIKKAEEIGLTEETIKFINKIMPGEVGHDGYYIDDGELMKV